jgi:hypothetical protein
MQSGLLGLIPLVIALVWAWISILRLYSTKPSGEASSLPAELLGVMAFLTVYSLTEITYSFYSVGWMVMAPLFAHVQLRVHLSHQEGVNPAFESAWLQNVRAKPAEVARRSFIQGNWLFR